MTLSIKTHCHHAECCCAECRDLFFVMLSVVMVNVVMLSVVMVNVIMLSVVMLIVAAPQFLAFSQVTILSKNIRLLIYDWTDLGCITY